MQQKITKKESMISHSEKIVRECVLCQQKSSNDLCVFLECCSGVVHVNCVRQLLSSYQERQPTCPKCLGPFSGNLLRFFHGSDGEITVPGREMKRLRLDDEVVVNDNISSKFYMILTRGILQDDVLRFPEPLPECGVSCILIRTSYLSIYDSILSNSKIIPRNIVTGVPGIGKSMFGLYFAWRYCHENPTSGIYLEQSFDRILCCHSHPHRNRIFTRSECLQVEKREFPYLVDLETNQTPQDWIGSFAIFFTSPLYSLTNNWLKKEAFDRYLMETWSYEELKIAQESHGIFREFEPLIELSLKERYDRIGGIPRYLFERQEIFDSFLRDALERNGSLIATNFFSLGKGQPADDNDQFYLLIHLEPPKESNQGRDIKREREIQRKNCRPVYQFATEFIWKTIFYSFSELILSNSLPLFARMKAPLLPPLVPQDFPPIERILSVTEREQLELLIRSIYLPSLLNETTQIISLREETLTEKIMSEMTEDYETFKFENLKFPSACSYLKENWERERVKNRIELEENVLYLFQERRDHSRDYGDGFFCQDGSLFILQISFSENYWMKSHGIQVISDHFQNRFSNCFLVFITSEYGKLRRKQEILLTNSLESDGFDDLMTMNQEIMMTDTVKCFKDNQWVLTSPDIYDFRFGLLKRFESLPR